MPNLTTARSKWEQTAFEFLTLSVSSKLSKRENKTKFQKNNPASFSKSQEICSRGKLLTFCLKTYTRRENFFF